uniref:EamA domain-containing protein n=1 Tax=Globodera pallida TaxID=36090 RepID=A0A183BNU3_GLOPA
MMSLVWVLSAELTRHLFIDLDFARPFFFTYAKSCMLSLLLLRYACSCPGATTTGGDGAELSKRKKKSTKTTKSGKAVYTQLENIALGSDGEEEEAVEENEKMLRGMMKMNNNDLNNNFSSGSSCSVEKTDEGGSEKSYEALNLTNAEFERFQLPSSATDGSELGSDDETLLRRDPAELDDTERQLFHALVDKKTRHQQRKRVRFSCIRQIRALPEKVEADAHLARLPYRQIVDRFQHCPNCPALSRDSTLFSYAVVFAPLWMISSVAAQTSLAFTSVTTANLFSASCPLFVLILGAYFGRNSADAFTGTKLALVLLNLSGVCVVSRASGSLLGSAIATFSAVANANRRCSAAWHCRHLLTDCVHTANSDITQFGHRAAIAIADRASNASGVCVVSRASGSLLGSAIATFSAVANAVYLFTLSRFSAKSKRIDAVLLLGTVGIFSLIVCTPLIVTLHNLGIERQLPLPTVRQMLVLVVNAFIGTLFADSVWLYATLLTGGLTSALSGSLSIPLSMLADSYMRNQPPSALQMLSSIPIMISFVGASLITTRHHSSAPHQEHASQKAKLSSPILSDESTDMDNHHSRLITSPSPSPSPSSPSFDSDSPAVQL